MSSTHLLAFLLFALQLQGCESNPYSEDVISAGRTNLRGTVNLGTEGNDNSGVLAWLEGFSLGSKTTTDGTFSLTLPPPDIQSTRGGVTGAFNLYFYMANFGIISEPVLVQNGEFVYSTGRINGQGEFILPIHLRQLLAVKTLVLPDTVVMGRRAILSARIFLTTDESDTVEVLYERNVDGVFNPIIFEEVNTDEGLVFSSTATGIVEGDTLKITKNTPEEIILIINASTEDFPVGVYNAIPFLFVLQQDIPDGLISFLGPGIHKLGPEYLKLPFFREMFPLNVLGPRL